MLSRGCKFLWGEYHEGYWWFEPLQTMRRTFLTGYVMLIDPHTVPSTRLLSAIVVTLTALILVMYSEPYKNPVDTQLFTLQQAPPPPPLPLPLRPQRLLLRSKPFGRRPIALTQDYRRSCPPPPPRCC